MSTTFTLQDYLLELRIKNKWTQGELGRQLGLAPSHMSEVAHSKRELSFGATKKAFKLGVPADILLQ